jgi:hypothetical protein
MLGDVKEMSVGVEQRKKCAKEMLGVVGLR